MTTEKDIKALLDVMAALRNPDSGCPWDLEQDFKSIAPYTIEEAYEVADAINREDMDDLKEELGDLLFQVVYHAQMAREAGDFEFYDVVKTITDKMVRRHPHVFEDKEAQSASDVNKIWEDRKDKEKKRQKAESIFDDVPLNLPALKRSEKLQKRVARYGFDWESTEQILEKLEEEIAELREALDSGKRENIKDELGDVLLVACNLGRKLEIDSEEAMRHANDKFMRRFKGIERELKSKNISLDDASLELMESLWQEEKKKEIRK